MKIETRMKKVQNMIFAGLKNLYKSQDVFDFNKFAIITLEALMLIEREEFLKDPKNPKDSANGSYLKNFRALRTDSLQISIPRSRKGHFKPMTLELIKNQQDQIGRLSLLLYRSGLSTREISKIMEEFFGESISRETISKLAEDFHKIRQAWLSRPLDAYYKCIYGDALFVNLRRNGSYTKESVYILYGVKEDNTRELILLEVNPTESATVWGEYLQSLEKRGLEQVGLFVVDGLQSLDKEIHRNFPEADLQKCVVHLQRNMLNKVRPKDREEFAIDLKKVFNNFESIDTRAKAIEKAKKMAEKWKKSYKFVEKLADEEYLSDYLTYTEYPVEVRRMIYTTNSIENLNRQIRKVIKTKVSFEKEDRLLDFIYMVIKDFEFNNWQKYPIHNFQFLERFPHQN